MTLSVDGWDRIAQARRPSLSRRLRQILRASNSPAEVALLLCDDDQIRQLNRDFRMKDKATDVLTFPADADFLDAFAGMGDEAPTPLLGDIAISIETAARQAKGCGHALEEEVCVLFAHGVAHLLDFDHERSPAEALAQAEFELGLLDAAGLDVNMALVGRSFGET